MKSLFILRHGKSDWHAAYGTDHDRPLAKRGIAAAEMMGRFLTHKRQVPDGVLSSSAVRARRTAELAVEAGQWECPLTCLDLLYGASVSDVVNLLMQQPDSASALMLVGHQPTWSELIADLTGGSAVHFPTAALARIDLEIDRWREVRAGEGVLRWLVTPKLLQERGREV